MSAAEQPRRRKRDRTESEVEVIKRESQALRGTIAETLADANAACFSEADYQLLKFHGIYQQDDRDTRGPRKQAGQEPEYYFMIRVALPGGALTAEQYLQLDRVATEHANNTLRITTRQGIQFHGVYKEHLRPTMQAIQAQLMTTLSACGDVERNVMASPAPLADPAHRLVQQVAADIAKDLLPATKAYYEIWMNGEKLHSTEEPPDPLYGAQYLPRKFKTGVALATDNSVDLYTYDAGLFAVVEDGRVLGFNIVAGGGLGMTHNKGDTIAALAQPVAFVGPADGVAAVRTIATIFRDHGNRIDRKHARLKYLIRERGIEWFREEFRQRATFHVAPPLNLPRPRFEDFVGRHPQGDGRWFYGVFVQNGRVADRDGERLKTALRTIFEQVRPNARLTANQNILLTDLAEAALPEVERILTAHGVPVGARLSLARRYSMACPALPTCGLALTESERVFARVVEAFEAELARLGLEDEPLTLRMTGCPNGCARPYTADIGFVGRKPGERYNVYVGGGLAGDRVADLWAEDVHIDALVSTARPLLEHFARHRQADEAFSDYYQRLVGRTEKRPFITGDEEAMSAKVNLGAST